MMPRPVQFYQQTTCFRKKICIGAGFHKFFIKLQRPRIPAAVRLQQLLFSGKIRHIFFRDLVAPMLTRYQDLLHFSFNLKNMDLPVLKPEKVKESMKEKTLYYSTEKLREIPRSV